MKEYTVEARISRYDTETGEWLETVTEEDVVVAEFDTCEEADAFLEMLKPNSNGPETVNQPEAERFSSRLDEFWAHVPKLPWKTRQALEALQGEIIALSNARGLPYISPDERRNR